MPEFKIKNHIIRFKKQPIKIEKDKYFFLSKEKLVNLRQKGDAKINKFKNFLKKYSRLYEILRNILYPVLIAGGKSKKDFLKIKNADKEKIVLNIASGNNTENCFINLDIFPFEKVDIIATADNLPFKDNSIDKIIFETGLEHIANPEKAVSEARRVLKKDGMIFITTPFIIGYHDSPLDYWRWTKEGVKLLLRDWEIIEIGTKGGIASSLGWILAEFFATALSFRIKLLHFIIFHFVLAVLIPLKFLDFIFNHYPTTSNIAALFYAIARKR